jgi:hypothetical protein
MLGNKMALRKKALESMDGGEMEIQIKKKPSLAMEGMEGDEAAEGFEQMMVSPEEKKMIMEMRGQSPDGEEAVEGDEVEME